MIFYHNITTWIKPAIKGLLTSLCSYVVFHRRQNFKYHRHIIELMLRRWRADACWITSINDSACRNQVDVRILYLWWLRSVTNMCIIGNESGILPWRFRTTQWSRNKSMDRKQFCSIRISIPTQRILTKISTLTFHNIRCAGLILKLYEFPLSRNYIFCETSFFKSSKTIHSAVTTALNIRQIVSDAISSHGTDIGKFGVRCPLWGCHTL